jgi:uncharacterized protein (TIGR02996 family)
MTSHSMTDAALLAAIRAAPDDDAPRLVYADWLDEHGQPERAEFIRVQCELARHEAPALRRQEAELLAAHHDAFAGPLAAPGLRFRFERGFIAGFGHTGLFHQSRAGRSRGPMNDYLSFRPGGQVVSCVTVAQPNAAVQLFQIGHLPVVPYRLETSEHSIRLRFTLSWLGREWECDGIMEGRRIRVRVHNRFAANAAEHHYIHVHIPGFDSFSET